MLSWWLNGKQRAGALPVFANSANTRNNLPFILQNTRGCINNCKGWVENIRVFSPWPIQLKCSLAWSPSWDLSPSLEPEMLLEFYPSFTRGGTLVLLAGAVFSNSTSMASLGQELSSRGCHIKVKIPCGRRPSLPHHQLDLLSQQSEAEYYLSTSNTILSISLLLFQKSSYLH